MNNQLCALDAEHRALFTSHVVPFCFVLVTLSNLETYREKGETYKERK
jgi:hypothetical protein